jgi:hypothetical protein
MDRVLMISNGLQKTLYQSLLFFYERINTDGKKKQPKANQAALWTAWHGLERN